MCLCVRYVVIYAQASTGMYVGTLRGQKSPRYRKLCAERNMTFFTWPQRKATDERGVGYAVFDSLGLSSRQDLVEM